MSDEATIKSTIGYTRELSEALNDLAGAWVEAANENKAWTTISRLTSGSGFWKMQNSVRGVIGVLAIYRENLKKTAEQQDDFNKLLTVHSKVRKQIPKISKAGLHGPDGRLMSKKALLKTDEAQEKMGIYTKAFGKTEGKARLQADMYKQIESQNKMLNEIEDKLAWQLKLSNLSWKERQAERIRLAKDKLTNFWNKNGGLLGIMKMVIKGFYSYILKAAVVATLLMLFLRKAWGWFKEIGSKIGLFDDIKAAFGNVITILSGVFDLFKAIFQGDLVGVFQAFWNKILPGLKDLIINSFKIVFKLARTVIESIIRGLISAVIKAGNDIKDAIAKKFRNPFKKTPEEKARQAAERQARAQTYQQRYANAGQASAYRGYRTYASGGVAGERVLVGEAGPELVTLPFGARVHSNTQSRRMGGTTIIINVSGSMGSTEQEVRRLADRLGREIGNRMNRTGSFSSAMGR